MYSFARILVAIAALVLASLSSEAAWWLHTKPLINRPSLGGLGTPGRKLDVALGLADFVAGRTSTQPLNLVVTDGTAIPGILAVGLNPNNAAVGSSIPITINTAAYSGGFATGAPDPVSPSMTNIARSYVMIADKTTASCPVTVPNGTYFGLPNCGFPPNYIAGLITAYNPATGAGTLLVKAKAGSTIITAANSLLVRHLPETVLGGGANSSNYMTFFGTAGQVSHVLNWDFRGYPGNSARGYVDMDPGGSNGLVQFDQCEFDWASNLLFSKGFFGGQNAAQAFSVDHSDLLWTPFRDAFVATVAADTPAGGNTITINEAVPQYVSDMVADITRSGTAVGGTIPFNGGSLTMSSKTVFWRVFNATNPDSLFATPINATSGNTLTMAGQVDNDINPHPTYPTIRSTLHAGDKLYIYRGELTGPMAWGPLVDFNYNRATALLDMFYLTSPPDGSPGSSFAPSFFANGKNPTWSYNLLTNVYGSAPNDHQDWIQTGHFAGHTKLELKNNVMQSVHLAGFQMGGNPRDLAQLLVAYAWTSGLEISNSIFDNSGLSTYPFYFQDGGAAPVRMVLKDQATGNIRVLFNLQNTATMSGGAFIGGGGNGVSSTGDPYMVSGFPTGLTALNNHTAKIDRVYMYNPGATYNLSRVSSSTDYALPIGAANAGATSLTTADTTALTPGLPITLGGVSYTVASVDSGTAFTVTPALSASITTSTKFVLPPSFTLANTASLANSLASPWGGNVHLTVKTAVARATTDDAASVAAASKLCFNESVAQVQPEMLLRRVGSVASDSTTNYSFPYQLYAKSVDTGANCVTLNGPINGTSKNYGAAAGDDVYFTTWTKPAVTNLVSMHDIYIKTSTFSANPAATGFTASGAFPLFYPNYPTLKPFSLYNLYQIFDNEGTYGFSDYASAAAASATAVMTDPLRFAQFQTNWPQLVPVDAPYLVPLIGSPKANPMTFDINATVDWPAKTTGTTPRSLTLAGVSSVNPPCPAPTGLTIAPNGSGSVILTYSASSTCGTGPGAGTNLGETVSIDGGAWSDPLGVIHSGSAYVVPSGAHTIAVRSMDAPDDYNVPRNPGTASAPVPAMVQ